MVESTDCRLSAVGAATALARFLRTRGNDTEATRYAREPLEMEGGTTFHFVTDGIESALEQAAAGEKDVSLGGGANVVQQYLAAGLLDEMVISVVPILLGAGARLFDDLGEPPPKLRQVQALEAPGVTHIRYVRAE